MLKNETTSSALEAVCDHLQANPDTYDQAAWGNGIPSCNTPGCIAGHVVAATKKGHEAYRRLTSRPGITEDERRDAVRAAATEGLGLEKTPRLFEPEWPRNWFTTADIRLAENHMKQVEPSPEIALAVLYAIRDGDLDEALEPSTMWDEEDDTAEDDGGATAATSPGD